MFRRLPIIAMCDGFEVRRTREGSRKQRNFIEIGGCRVWLHVYLAEKYIRPLLPGEVVHHKDFNYSNDSIFNLEIMTRGDHIRIHKPMLGYKFSDDQRKRLSESHKGQKAWNKGVKGFKHSEKARENMSTAQKGRKITWGDKISKSKTKVTESQLLDFITKNPICTLKSIMKHFKLKTPGPITKYGGIGRLKEKAKNE